MKKPTNVTILNFLPSILKNSSPTSSESMEKEVNELLKEKFLDQNKFTQDVEQLVLNTELNYIEAIISYCEEKNIDLKKKKKSNINLASKRPIQNAIETLDIEPLDEKNLVNDKKKSEKFEIDDPW